MPDPTIYPTLYVAIGGVVRATGALVVAIVSASSSSRSARPSERSAEAAEASLVEQRRANAHADAEAAGRIVGWSAPLPWKPDFYRVVNTGQARAFAARLTVESGLVHEVDAPPRDVEPGDFLAYASWGVDHTDPAIIRVH